VFGLGEGANGRGRAPERVYLDDAGAALVLHAEGALSLPALLDALDPDRRDVDRHSVLESRAQESMDVRVGRAIPSSVLMDGKHALGAPSRAPDAVM